MAERWCGTLPYKYIEVMATDDGQTRVCSLFPESHPSGWLSQPYFLYKKDLFWPLPLKKKTDTNRTATFSEDDSG
jgi:hypothetical protein